MKENDAFTRISDEIDATGGNFLVSDHTLDNFRNDIWDPKFFSRLTQTCSEKEILDKCHEEYIKLVENYQPTSYSDKTIKELEKIYLGAKSYFKIK